jgi:hypothetical protein
MMIVLVIIPLFGGLLVEKLKGEERIFLLGDFILRLTIFLFILLKCFLFREYSEK